MKAKLYIACCTSDIILCVSDSPDKILEVLGNVSLSVFLLVHLYKHLCSHKLLCFGYRSMETPCFIGELHESVDSEVVSFPMELL